MQLQIKQNEVNYHSCCSHAGRQEMQEYYCWKSLLKFLPIWKQVLKIVTVIS
jgi:hypothetical protein